MLGEEFDDEELKELFDRWDEDKSGSLDFREFCVMMNGWDTQFGTGYERAYNVATKRGMIGKASREFKKWWNKAEEEKAQVEAAKKKMQGKRAEQQELALKYWDHEKIQKQRELEEAYKHSQALPKI